MADQVNLPDDQVKVKMACCPECGNPILVSVAHTMDKKDVMEFGELALDGFLIKEIPLLDYRAQKIELFCKENCSRKH